MFRAEDGAWAKALWWVRGWHVYVAAEREKCMKSQDSGGVGQRLLDAGAAREGGEQRGASSALGLDSTPPAPRREQPERGRHGGQESRMRLGGWPR